MKKQVIITVFILIFLIKITQVVADDGYVLIVYYDFEGEAPKPGDTLTINAELYKERNRITDSVKVEIDHIGGIDNLNTPISMVDDGKGIFSYELTVPSVVDDTYIYLSFSAFVDREEVDSGGLSIEIYVDKEALSRPISLISHQVAAPGETVEVFTYIPDIEFGRVDSSDVSVTVDFEIPGSSLESIEEKSTYIGDGFFSASYNIPFDVVVEDGYYNTPQLSVDIFSEYSGEEFNDWFLIDIGYFTLFTKAAFTNDELTIDVLVLDLDYTPIEGVKINTQIELVNESYQSETITLLLPKTDAYGRSTKTIKITETDIRVIYGDVNATKDNLSSFRRFYLSLYEDYWHEYFMVVPTLEYLINMLENYEKGVSMDLTGYLEGKKLVNAKIDVYASWRGGLIDIFTIKTDNEGRFSFDIDWPKNFGSLPQDLMEITFVYNNGTDWFEYEFLMTRPTDLDYNSGSKPIINYNDYNNYQVVTVSYQLSSSDKIGLIYVMPIYTEYSLFNLLTSGTAGPFIDSDGILGASFSKPTNGIISFQNIIDKAFTLEYLMIIIQIPDSSASMGFRYVYWLLDPDGEPISEQSENITGFDMFSGGVLFICMITLVFLKRRKKLD
ncbi:MAG: hypothetical protein ACFE98_19465 [Candidatus Hermodarchaeota archaeon]